MGNRVSVLPLSIPLDISDPARRLEAVSFRTEAMKNARIADLLGLVGTWLNAAPAPLQGTLSALPMASPLTPVFNVICTNTRGPDSPIYTVGKRMLTYYPFVPLGHEMGVGFALTSYNGKLYFGITGDAKAAPDVDRLREFLDVSFAELRKAAGLAANSPLRKPASSVAPLVAKAAAGS